MNMAQDEQQILQQLRAIFVEMFDLDESQIVPEARLYEDLDIDSIDAVDLVTRLKELTGTRVQPEDFKSVRTVQDVVEVTEKLVQSQ